MQEHDQDKFKDYMTQSILKEHLESLVKVKKILGNVISEKRIVTQLASSRRLGQAREGFGEKEPI